MRRKLMVGFAVCAAVIAGGVAWSSRANQDPGPAKAAESALPIRHVVLFNSGVGYLQREGEVSGDAKVDLSFPATDINDLLKSLILQDLGGGRVSTVSYDSHDPIDRILASFAIDLNNNPTFGQILNQARGEKIEIQLMSKEKSIPAKLTGQIVGMETRTAAPKDGPTSADFLNLSGADGMQSIPLEQILGVRFLNPALDNEFQRALKVLAGAHDTQKKTVSVGFSGAGKRPVRVGYVVERPIWKTSYRLRMEPNGKVFLQGWAMVENTSDDDWNDVRMVLVSGRPISFKMNLYEPLFLPRPEVEPELFASLRPPVYTGAMEGKDIKKAAEKMEQAKAQEVLQEALPQAQMALPLAKQLEALKDDKKYQNSIRNQVQDVQNRLTYDELQRRRGLVEHAKKDAADRGPAIAMNFKEGIQSVASSAEVGDYYQYVIDQRVSLSRQKSAMLPIVDQSIEGAKLSIFNESVHPKYPLLGLRLKNTSGQPLMQGPITVYESSTYAGDTRILDLQPNEERLLSYALDQGTEVKTETKSRPGDVILFTFGLSVHANYTERQTKTYTIKNRSTHDRVVVVEHPIRDGWKLVEPAKPAEKSRDVYRFEVKVPAGATESLAVAEEQQRGASAHADGAVGGYYFTDLKTRAVEIVTKHEEILQSLSVTKGVLTPTLKARESRARNVSASDTDRTYKFDHVVRDGWTLLLSKDEQVKGPKVHRTVMKVKAGDTAQQDVNEVRVYQDKPRLVRDIPESKLREYLNSSAVSAPVKAGLTKTLEMSKRLADVTKEASDLERQLRVLSDDQSRLRENLKIIPQTSEPYKKFLDKFVTQESEIDALQRQIRNAQTAVAVAQREYDAFLAIWSAE